MNGRAGSNFMYQNLHNYAQTKNRQPAELAGMLAPAELFNPAADIPEPVIPAELQAKPVANEGVKYLLPPKTAPLELEYVPGEINNSKPIPLVDLPESARTEKYQDMSYNNVNDHYDSSVNYDKMYGALV